MTDKASSFRALHQGPIFLLPNAWDAASARMMEQAGFPAIATSSAALAWCLGYGDGEAMPFDALLYMTGRMLSGLSVPLTVDLESGFGRSPEAIAGNALAFARMGVAGINLEDSDKTTGDSLRPVADQMAIIDEIRQALTAEGHDLFINARSDLFWMGLGASETRLAATIDRCNAYVAAGADGVFVPGLTEFSQIAELASSVEAPLNILAFAADNLLPRLVEAGVARVSTGSGAYRRVAADVAGLCRSLNDDPGLGNLFDGPLSYPALQNLMAGGA